MKKICFAALFLVVAWGCKKNEIDAEPTNTDVITKSAWKYDDAGLDIDKNGSIELSLSSQIPDCVKDNTLTFSSNGTGSINEGVNVCEGASQSTNITWSFAGNENVLRLDGGSIGGLNGMLNIIALTQTSLVLSKDTTLQGFGTGAVIVKLKH